MLFEISSKYRTTHARHAYLNTQLRIAYKDGAHDVIWEGVCWSSCECFRLKASEVNNWNLDGVQWCSDGCIPTIHSLAHWWCTWPVSEWCAYFGPCALGTGMLKCTHSEVLKQASVKSRRHWRGACRRMFIICNWVYWQMALYIVINSRGHGLLDMSCI